MHASSSIPRTVLVTGGSSGIGTAIVRSMAAQGYRVWFTYHSGRERAQALLSELDDQGSLTHQAFLLDQSDAMSVRGLVDRLPGPVDVLINNAAVGTETVKMAGTNVNPEAEDELFFRVNCLGPLWLTRLLLPGMIRRGAGTVIIMSSVGGGVTAFPGFSLADGMSKAAVAFLTTQLAAETYHDPVTIVCVCPGATDTPMYRASSLDPLDPATRKAFLERLPQGRLIDAGEIAQLVCWLCGPQAQILHGAIIDASMGLGSHPGPLTAFGFDQKGNPPSTSGT